MQTLYDNADKFRRRTRAWMRNPIWKWYIVHIGHMDSLMPKYYWRFTQMRGAYALSFGADVVANYANGPND